MDKKRIAKYAHAFIGGKPKVERFYNADESKKIDIMTCEEGYCAGIHTLATIGLSSMDIGMTVQNYDLKVELMLAGIPNNTMLGNILSTIAFQIMDIGTCRYGMLIPDVIAEYMPNHAMKHVVLMSPVFWNKYKVFTSETEKVAWLLAVPVSDRERKYILTNGIEVFDRLLGKKKADIFNLVRTSIL
ncbi:MAG: suppressor of fused domain protein [Eubacteriales bacterium]|nr:suppressor of fused domain protein [Eubacteriales bacterium]